MFESFRPFAEIVLVSSESEPFDNRTRIMALDQMKTAESNKGDHLSDLIYILAVEVLSSTYVTKTIREQAVQLLLIREEQAITLDEAQREEVTAIFEKESKISAIKRVREITGCGLREAKQYVETLPCYFSYVVDSERVIINVPSGGEQTQDILLKFVPYNNGSWHSEAETLARVMHTQISSCFSEQLKKMLEALRTGAVKS